jgi:hypothetical protein
LYVFWVYFSRKLDHFFFPALFNETMVQLETMLPVETNIKVNASPQLHEEPVPVLLLHAVSG